MNPLAILGLVQLGASLIGSWRAQQEASRQQALLESALDRQLQAALEALNTAARMANRDFASVLAPFYSTLEGRALQGMRAEASAAGLTGSGLETAAALGIRGDVAAALARDIANLQANQGLQLLQAQQAFAGLLGEQARMRGALMESMAKAGEVNLSWLPMLLQTNPNLFNIDLSWLGNLFGGGAPAGTPGRPGDLVPIRPVV